MTDTENTSNRYANVPAFAGVIKRVIAHYGHQAKVFVQTDGTLRIAARSVALASIIIEQAERASDVKLSDIAEHYQVRFWGSDLVATYPTTKDPMAKGIDKSTGAIIALTDPELTYPWRYTCEHCGQQPLHHTSRCPNRKR